MCFRVIIIIIISQTRFRLVVVVVGNSSCATISSVHEIQRSFLRFLIFTIIVNIGRGLISYYYYFTCFFRKRENFYHFSPISRKIFGNDSK